VRWKGGRNMESTKKQLSEVVRLGIRPCAFCILKRTEYCQVNPPKISTRARKIPNLKQVYSSSCPQSIIKENLMKMISWFFSDDKEAIDVVSILEIPKIEYKKAILEHIRPCSTCTASSNDQCKTCSSDDEKMDLLQIVDEFFETKGSG